VHPVDERMHAFVAWHGQIPTGAERIEDQRARGHAVSWIRRNLGVGIIHSHVIGYELGHRWWTLFFDRIATVGPDGAECWQVEAYDHNGKSWSERYHFWPEHCRWQPALCQKNGGDNQGHLGMLRSDQLDTPSPVSAMAVTE
jgi:hypothetical protein